MAAIRPRHLTPGRAVLERTKRVHASPALVAGDEELVAPLRPLTMGGQLSAGDPACENADR